MSDPTIDSPSLFDLPLIKPNFSIESGLLQKGYRYIVGLDEAGRGPLAGPVVASGVILNPDAIPDGLNDSKKLSKHKREILFEVIMEQALAICVCSLSAESIDQHNILQASLMAMAKATKGLSIIPDFALIDGRDVPKGLPCSAEALIKGDQRSVSIAAASIIAKVMRDRMMARTALFHPTYGFERHAGYGTKIHKSALNEKGAIPRLHRLSFAPIRNLNPSIE